MSDAADWTEPDSAVTEKDRPPARRLIEKSAFAAMAAFHRLHGAVADAQPARSGERWDYDKGTSPGEPDAPARDAELIKRDAEIVRRFRERLAEAFDCPTSYP